MIPTIEFTAQEQAAQSLQADTVIRGVKALRLQGCLLLRDVFPTEFIDTLRAAHLARNESFFRSERPAESGEVGNKRFMGAVDLSPPFNTPRLYANPFVLPILQALFGEEMVLGCFGSVTSLPGAKNQHLHRDGPPLFNKAVNRSIPPYAVTLFVPLVEFNAQTGTTRLFPDTHINTDLDPATAPFVDPVVPIGSCFLSDYRLYHQGLANHSELIRPLLFSVFHQPWFKDYKNHASLPFLKISDAEYAKIPAEHRSLFSWIEHYRAGLY